jgi:hypothetical protein
LCSRRTRCWLCIHALLCGVLSTQEEEWQ